MFNLKPSILKLCLTDPVLGHQVANLIDQAHDDIKKDLRLAILRKLEQRQLYSLENGWINDAPDYIDAYLRIRLFPERRSVTAGVDGDQMEDFHP
jgi:hypothetical protein